MSTSTCTHHNDQQRTECTVCLVAQLRAELDNREPRSITSQNRRHIARLELQRDRLQLKVKRLNDLVKDMLK